jgi:transcriptional regulator with XRE-family HTH domain
VTEQSVHEDSGPADLLYAKRLGARLRRIRKQQGHSLLAVEQLTGAEFKGSLLGAYERAERSISVHRLQRLAAFYGIPVGQLLPRGGEIDGSEDVDPQPARSTAGNVTIDLVQLAQLDTPDSSRLREYLRAIQVDRQDFNGRVLTIRGSDLSVVTLLLGVPLSKVRARLRDLGLLAEDL